MRRASIILLAGAAALCSGCGSGHSGRPLRSATLVLDFTPNAVHAGIYSALAHGLDRAQGVRLKVVVPSASTDSIKLLDSGRVDFALLDIHDLAIARARGADIVGIMAIVERPLAAVIAAPKIRSPQQLQGQTVGVTGVPSDTAVLDSIVAGAGGKPPAVKTIDIGFNAVAALLSHRVAGATAFWNDEGVTIQRRRAGFHVFKVDAYGAPAYPELILCTSATALRRDPGLAPKVVRALAGGYRKTLADPRAAESALESRVQGLDPKLLDAELRALLPAFTTARGQVGALDPATLRAWARWEVRFRIVSRTPDIKTMFDSALSRG
jgi:ABC-type nitrate/sulfonate/bicarbonate transport system substrate-binding protein